MLLLLVLVLLLLGGGGGYYGYSRWGPGGGIGIFGPGPNNPVGLLPRRRGACQPRGAVMELVEILNGTKRPRNSQGRFNPARRNLTASERWP
jgi:hypothetical protein